MAYQHIVNVLLLALLTSPYVVNSQMTVDNACSSVQVDETQCTIQQDILQELKQLRQSDADTRQQLAELKCFGMSQVIHSHTPPYILLQGPVKIRAVSVRITII